MEIDAIKTKMTNRACHTNGQREQFHFHQMNEAFECI